MASIVDTQEKYSEEVSEYYPFRQRFHAAEGDLHWQEGSWGLRADATRGATLGAKGNEGRVLLPNGVPVT